MSEKMGCGDFPGVAIRVGKVAGVASPVGRVRGLDRSAARTASAGSVRASVLAPRVDRTRTRRAPFAESTSLAHRPPEPVLAYDLGQRREVPPALPFEVGCALQFPDRA